MAPQAYALAQVHGLQGHKRLNRYESCKDWAHYIKLQNYCVDMLTEYSLSGWDMAYILQADGELHEKMKKKEDCC